MKDLLGDAVQYLIPQLKVKVEFYEGKPHQRGTAGHGGHDGGGNRTRAQRRHGFQRHQAGQDWKPASWCRCRRSSPKAKRSASTPPKAPTRNARSRRFSAMPPSAPEQSSSSLGTQSADPAARRPSSMRATTGGSCRAQLPLGRRRVGAFDRRSAMWEWTAPAWRRRRSRILLPLPPRAAPARAPPALPRARGSAAALCRIMASAGTSSHRSSNRLRSVCLQRLVDQLIQAQRAKQRIAAQPRDQFRPARQNPGLRPAQQLVAAEGDQVRAGLQAFRRPAARRCRTAADPPRIRCPGLRRPGCRARAPAPPARAIPARAVKPDMRKLLGCTRSSRRRALADGRAVIVDVRPVGGADLAQCRAGARHDLGDAEAVADLDQFAARNHHLAAPAPVR